jgi:hypothetical protein
MEQKLSIIGKKSPLCISDNADTVKHFSSTLQRSPSMQYSLIIADE